MAQAERAARMPFAERAFKIVTAGIALLFAGFMLGTGVVLAVILWTWAAR